MAQNTSSAVMQQRTEPNDSFDYFGTPPWATRALCERISTGIGSVAWDPACGRGHMTRPLAEYFPNVLASDVQDLGFGHVHDFLMPRRHDPEVSWIITNPPFRLAEEFIYEARKIATMGVAVLVRSSFAEGIDRYHKLFSKTPPTMRMQFVERVVMHKGDPPDPDIQVPYFNKTKDRWEKRKPTSATSYEWMVWQKFPLRTGCSAEWIGPCRKRLTKPNDYIVPEISI